MDSIFLKDFRSLPKIISYNANLYPDNTALGLYDGISYTYSELNSLKKYIETMLYSIGIEKNDRVAIYSENNPHWGAAYFGIMTIGSITVPILPDFMGKEVHTILEHSKAKVLFISHKLIPLNNIAISRIVKIYTPNIMIIYL